jgi:cytochrome c
VLQQIGITDMTKWILRFVFMLPLLFTTGAFAGDSGTPDEAKAMAIRAGELLKAEGPEKAFPEFEKGAAFHDRDLYVMVYDQTGKCVSHGANPGLIGNTLIDLKDTDGKYLIKDLVAVDDAAWVDYKWPHPVTKKLEPKVTYVVRVGDYRVGVGAYK